MSSTKRIIDLQTTSSVGSDDYVMLDGATNGTKKFLFKDILDAIEAVEQGTSLANGAVDTDALASGAVTNAKVATDAVATTNIQNGAVTESKINDGAVTTTKLATSSVTTAKIADNNVTTDKLAANAVTTAKIADNNVTTDKLAANAVTTAKITDGAVTNAKVATDAIATANIQDDSVTTDKLADAAVTFDKLDDEIIETLDFKADIDGYYAQMTVGSADNLTARGDAVEAEFLYRTSGGISDIESGNATIKSIKGNTVRWNQLVVGTTNFGWNAVSLASQITATDEELTITSSAQTSGVVGAASKILDFVVDHKYYLKFLAKSTLENASVGASLNSATNNVNNVIPMTTLTSSYSQLSGMCVYTTPSSGTARIRIATGSGFTSGNSVTIKAIQLFDLTQLYGAGNEPSTVVEFEALYPEPYYPYDAGSLKPVQLEGIETTGFNQWDEMWEKGYISDATGENNNTSPANYLRSKNHIPVFPSTEYYFARIGTTGQAGKVYYYDSSKAFLSWESFTFGGAAKTTPANARYMRFWTNYTGSYENNICINLSWSGRRNGEYEESWKAERAIAASTYFPTGLKKAGAIFDELTADAAIQRVGSVDLGTLDWSVVSSPSEHVFRVDARNIDNLKRYSGAIPANAEIIGYQVMDYNTISASDDKCFAVSGSTAYRFVIIDQAYSDAADFKAAMNGVYMFYELATPTTTPIDPPLNLTYKVDDWGTEKVMIPEGTVSAVPTFDIVYGMNAVDTIRRLPDLYAGKAETEAALDTKANIDGYYQQLTAGAADNLTGRGDATGGEYLFRTTAGTASVSDEGVATVKSIKGRTLVWNQLIQTPYTFVSQGRTSIGGIPITVTDNYISFDGNLSETGGSLLIENYGNLGFVQGHKYALTGIDEIDTDLIIYARDATSRILSVDRLPIAIFTSNCTSTDTVIYLQVTGGSGVHRSFKGIPQLFDLTAMFGAGNEPSSVAEFEALYPLPYYEYDAGSLLSVNMTGIETNGFNQWDGTFKSGNQHFDYTTGTFDSSGGWVCTDKIPAFPDTVYYLRADIASGVASNIVVGCWDAGDNYLGHIRYGAWNSMTSAAKPNTAYIRAEWTRATSVTNVCINLSWSGYRNGEYESYWSDQRLIPAGILRSAGRFYDEQTETERIERINAITVNATNGTGGIVIANTGNENLKAFIFDNAAWNRMTNNAPRPSVASNAAVICDKLPTTASGYSGWTAPSIQLGPDNSADIIFAVAEGVSTVADLNTWLANNPLTIYYAMRDADFVTTTYDPPLNLDYRYADFGTEMVMVPDGEMSAPPTIEAVYGINATDTIRNLPTDYTSKKSLENLIAALDAHNSTTTTMTWNEGQQAYTFAIVDNE